MVACPGLSWVQSGGPVTTESIVRFDTWFELFEDPRENGGGIWNFGNVTWKQIDIESCVIPLFLLILAWRIHFWHRFCILTSQTITFPTECGIESPILASFVYFDESKYQNSWWPPFTNSIFFCFELYNPYYLLNCTRKTRFYCLIRVSDVNFSKNNGSDDLNMKTVVGKMILHGFPWPFTFELHFQYGRRRPSWILMVGLVKIQKRCQKWIPHAILCRKSGITQLSMSICFQDTFPIWPPAAILDFAFLQIPLAFSRGSWGLNLF